MIRGQLLLLMIVASCGPPPDTAAPKSSAEVEPVQPSAQEPASMTIASPWSIAYHDGSGNGYRLWQDDVVAHFEYTPVTPETSSSGTYSGGQPASGELSALQVRQVWSRVDALRARKDLHVETRSMGTGAFSLSAPGESSTFLVRPSTELAEFEASLAPFR